MQLLEVALKTELLISLASELLCGGLRSRGNTGALLAGSRAHPQAASACPDKGCTHSS